MGEECLPGFAAVPRESRSQSPRSPACSKQDRDKGCWGQGWHLSTQGGIGVPTQPLRAPQGRCLASHTPPGGDTAMWHCHHPPVPARTHFAAVRGLAVNHLLADGAAKSKGVRRCHAAQSPPCPHPEHPVTPKAPSQPTGRGWGRKRPPVPAGKGRGGSQEGGSSITASLTLFSLK